MDKKFIRCEIQDSGLRRVVGFYETGEEVECFSYYDDELSFSPEEFIGLTLEEAQALFCKRDKQFLQS